MKYLLKYLHLLISRKHLPALVKLPAILLLSLFLSAGLNQSLKAQTVEVFSGAGTFYTPSYVKSIKVECWGGGGAGGRATGNPGSGGGGAGGAYSASVLSSLNSSYSVTVGAAKTSAGSNTASLNNGNPSWFGSTTNVYAIGGPGGAGTSNNYANGARGTGTTTGCYGTVKYAGGNGTVGVYTSNVAGGAGGGGAGSTGTGNSASSGTGGVAKYENGGAGANGVANSTSGAAGSSYGGGGSGGKANASANQTGGTGAQGYVRVSYLPEITGNTSVCQNYITTLSNAVSGGTWTSANTSVATINSSSGEVTGVAAGTTEITYSVPSGITSYNLVVFTTVTVDPTSVGGTASSSQTLCYNTSPADLTLSGNTGSVVRWEKSTDPGFSSPTTISATTTTLAGSTIGNLTASTYFRAVVQSGVCAEANSSAVLITVRPTPTASISGTTSVCLNTTAPNVTFTNPQSLPVTITYNIGGANQTTINVGAGTTATVAAPTSTSGTFDYNLVSVVYQTTPICSNTISGTATITVDPLSVGGTVASAQTICYNTSPANLTLSGNTGAVIRWEKSTNSGFTSPTTIAGTSTTLAGSTIGNLTTNTYFRAVVKSGACSEANSSSVLITVRPTPTASISGTTTICLNATAPNLTFTNPQSIAVTITYNINGSNQTTINVGAGTTATVAAPTTTSGVFVYNLVSVAYQTTPICTASLGSSATITVTPTVGTPTTITISAGSEPACQLTNGTTTTTYATTATNNAGFNWSVSNSAAGTIGASTGIMTWTNGFSGSVDIRVTASGCNGPSSLVTRSVTVVPTVGTPGTPTPSATTICQGSSNTVYTTTATNATSYTWSVTGSGNSISGTGTTGTVTWSSTFSGQATVSVIANGCNGPSASASTTVNVEPAPVAPTLSSATPVSGSIICAGYNLGTATFTGGSGAGSNEYQFSIDGGSNWSTYTNGAAIVTTAATTSVQVRARRTGTVCSASNYNTYTIWTIGDVPTAPLLSSATPANGSTVCVGYNTGTVTGDGGSGGSTGAVAEYQISINGGGLYSTYTNGAAISTTGATGSIIVRARRTGGNYGCSTSGWNTICSWTLASAMTIPTLNVATPASGTTICAGYSPSATINAGSGGSTGAADVYQYSINGGSSWSAYTSGASITTTGASTSVQVRVSRSAGGYGCSTLGPTVIATWPVSTATANPTLNEAIPASGITICAGYSPGAIINAGSGGSSGAADLYEYSINNGTSWATYSSGTAIVTTGATGHVQIRVSRSGGNYGCSATSPATIVSWPVGTATTNPILNTATPVSGTAICAGYNGPGATITAGSGGSGGAADVYEYSINNGSNWAAYTAGASINTTGASGNIMIRVSRTAGSYGCSATGPVTIVTWPVASAPVSPTLGSASPASGTVICAGYNSGTVTGTGGSGGSGGSVNEYQVSLNGGGAYSSYTSGATINTAGATGSVIVQARRSAGSYGCSNTVWTTLCTWAVSTATVNPSLNVATPANGTSICAGYSVNATITAGSGGSAGAADTYEFSIDNGGTWSTYTSGSSITTTTATENVLIRVRRSAGSYGCSATGPTTIVTWPVSSAPVSPALGSASPANGGSICAGNNTGTVTGTGGSGGSTGAANEYQVSINGGSSYSSYTSGAAITTTGATGSVIVQARRSGGSYGCANTDWTTICTWTVYQVPTITLGANPSVNQGTTIANLPYTATTGSPDQYSIDYDVTANNAGFVDVSNVTLGLSQIALAVPSAAALATYYGTLTVRNSAASCSSTSYSISVTVGQNLLTVAFLSATQKSLKESGTVYISVILSATSSSTVTIPFTVNSSSTATGGGTDYTITSSPVTIAAGQRTGAIGITITDETIDESDETIIVNMGTPTNAIQGSIITQTVTILDDDPYPTGSIAVNRMGVSTTPADLVSNVLLTGCLTASNISFTGNTNQIGHFTKGASSFPITEGVILSTGNVALAEGPNKDFGTTTQYGGAGDSYINSISGGTSYDAAVLEFDFIPEGNTLQFNYVFASEEYAEFVEESSNDAFAFLLSGYGITGTENIALIPSTSTAVSINTIHGQGNETGNTYHADILGLLPYATNFGVPWERIYDATGAFTYNSSACYYKLTPTIYSSRVPENASYYVDNGQFMNRDLVNSSGKRQIQYENLSGQNGTSEMEFDGRTTVLTATHAVTPCQTYHIKMVIADVNDEKWDSGVFIQAKSFTSNEVQISSHIGAISGDAVNMYEGCDGSYIRFQRATGADNSETFTFPVIISGTATNGVDYVYTTSVGTTIGDGTFPSSATIPMGSDYVDYYYKAQSDGTIEGSETILFRVSNGCPCDPSPTYLEKSVTIIDVPQIQASTVSVIQCVSAGNPVATITVNMQGSLDPNDYQFSLDGGAFQASNAFNIVSEEADGSDIVGTSHYITVKDQYSCNSITENNIIIPAIAEFEASAGSDISMCEGQSGIQLSGSGGMYYSWACSPPGGMTYLSSNSIANPTVSSSIPAGTYTFTVTAQNQLGADPACQGTDDMVLTVKTRPSVAITADDYSACNSQAIQLTATVTNGGASPTYLWNPTTDLSSPTIGNPVYTPVVSAYTAQFLTLTVTATNGCSVVGSAPEIDIYPSPTITTGTIVNATCGSATGSATVSASSSGVNPAPTFNYLWDAAAGNQTTATATNLAAGTYTVTVTDATHGCSNSKQVTVGSTADNTAPTAVCQNASVTLDASGNATITTADINNGSTDNCTPAGSLILSLDKTTFNTSNVGDNTVTLTVKDLSNNTSTCTATVTVSYSASCNITASRDVWYEQFTGDANGLMDDAAGDWSTSVNSSFFSIFTTAMRASRQNATYWLSKSIDIRSYTNLNIKVDTWESGTLATTDWIRFEYSTDAGANYTTFSNPTNGQYTDDLTNSGSTTPYYACTPVSDNSYLLIKITVKDNSGTSQYHYFDNIHVTGDPAMEATAAITNVSCNGGSNGAINVTVTKGVAPYTYSWTGTGVVTANEDQTGLTAGTYSLVVTDANNVLSNTFSFTVTQPAADAAIATNLAVSDFSICNPATTDAIFTITSAASGVHYELQTTSGTSLSPAVTGVGTGGNLNLTLLQANMPATTTTYMIHAVSSSGCTNAYLTDQPVLTVTTTAAPTGSASQSFCSSSAPKVSNLALTGSNIIWYNAQSGGSVVAGTTNLTNGTTYYASQTINGCESTTRRAVTATVYTTPSILSVTHGVVCGSGTATIYATANAGTVNWYAAQTGGLPIGSGNSYTTLEISATTSYWVDGENNGCTTSSRSQVIATVYPLPTITLGTNPVICYGVTSASLPYTATSGGANQYSIVFSEGAITAGFENVNNSILPSSPITINVPANVAAGAYTGTLTVRNSANGCVSTTRPISISINAPTSILSQSTAGQTTCINGSFAPITVSATGLNLSYQWYSNTTATNSGGSPLGASNGAQTSSYTPQASAAGTLFYYCTVTGSCGAAVSTSISGAFVTQPATTASISGGSSPICYNGTPGTLTATGGGGSGSYTYLWYKNGVSTGVTNQSYAPGNLTASATFYCDITSGYCVAATSNVISITVYNDLTASISGGSSPICYNTAPGTLTATGGGGTGSYTYLWYKNGTSTGITTQTYAPGNLTASSSFYCAITSGSCGTVNTSTTSITVYNNLSASIAGGSTPICYNTAPGMLTATGSGGTGSYTYLWYKNGTTTGVTTQTYTPGNLMASSTFYCAITSGSCGTVNTSTTSITVYNNLLASISGGTSPICYNNAPGILTATGSGGTGSYTYLWYKDGISTTVTTQTYTPGNLIATSLYYCAVTSGSCGTVNTTTTTITVYDNLTASVSGGTSPICNGTAPGILTATGDGGTGSYTYQWYRTSGVISGATSASYTPGNLTATTGYYCAITSGSCGTVTSNTVTITVYGALSASVSGGNTPICYNTSAGTLTAVGSGGTGSYTYQWYSGAGIVNGATNAIYNPGNLTATTDYYCAVTSGSCGTFYTPAKTITVYNNLTAGISGGVTPICYNSSPGTLTATGSGGTGSYTYQWYTTAGVIDGATGAAYTPENVTATTGYYCAVTSGSCGTVNTQTTTITVHNNLTSAITGGSSPICYNTSPGSLTATGGGGEGTYTYLWYKNDISTGITSQSYSPGALNVSATFYCAITSGSCGTVNSNIVSITVYGQFSANISGGTSPICYNTSPGIFTATGSGGTGSYTYLWYKNGFSTGVTTQTYSPGALTETTAFYCAVTSGSCGTVSTSSVNITVYGNLTAGISGGSSPICYNTAPGTFTAEGGGGTGTYTYLWYKDAVSTGITTQTYEPGNLTASSSFYCAITSGTCGTVNTETTSITVYNNLTAAISGGSTPVCYNSSPGIFTATGGGGTGSYTYLWYLNGSSTGITTGTYTPGTLISSSNIYCAITSGSCGTVNTPTTSITVYSELTSTIGGANTPICYNTAPGTFTATGGGGTGSFNYLWYKNGTSTGVTSQTYAPGILTESTQFYCAISSGSCGPVNSATSTIVVTPLPNATITYPDSPYCTSLTGTQPVTRTGTAGGTYSSTVGLTIDSSTGAITPGSSTPGTYTVTYTVPATGGCNEYSTTTQLTVIHDLVWTGAVDTDWNDAGNWSCLVVPDLTTNVLIPDVTNQPILSSGAIGMAKDLEINSGSSLTVTGNTLQIAGVISNSGTFRATAGTIEMKGSEVQMLPADVFITDTIMNLTVDNSNGVTLGGPLNITGIVKAQTGDLTTGGYLTLISTASQTALIDGSGSGEVSGNVKMERYLATAFGYKYFSSPFQSATVSQFDAYRDTSSTAFPTFYLYNENRLTGAGEDMSGWTIYSTPSGILNQLEGYAVNFGPVSVAKTPFLTGIVNNGDMDRILQNHNRTYTQGFNLVGNPYPSPIDWNEAGWTKDNIDNAVYFFNATGTTGIPAADDTIQYQGTYSSYVNGISTGNGTNIIAAMQGFFVHVSNSATYPVTGTLGTSNLVRVNDLNPTFKSKVVDDRPILWFTLTSDVPNAVEDVALISFDYNSTQAFDNDLDALKMKNTDPLVPNLYTFSVESKQLSINSMPLLSDSITEIPLGIQTLKDGDIIFKAKDIRYVPENIHIYLLDAEMNIIQDLEADPDYQVNLKAGEYNQRFSLIFSINVLTDPANITQKLFKTMRYQDSFLIMANLPYSTSGTLMVTNMAGQVLIKQQVYGNDVISIAPMVSAGIFIISLQAGNRIQSEKVLMRLNYE